MKRAYLILIVILGLVGGCGRKNETPTGGEEEIGVLHLSTKKQEAAGIQTAKVEKGHLVLALPVTGRVTQDTDEVAYLFPRASGTFKSALRGIGDHVQKGEALFQVGRAIIRAPRSGTLLSINARSGDRVDPLTSLGAVGETETLRVVFDIFPKDVGFVRLGQKTAIYPLGSTEEKFEGAVDYVSPQMDRTTQTLKVGAGVQNRGGILKFGMYVAGELYRELEPLSLLVPDSAIQMIDGKKSVFVKKSEEKFELREITIGQTGKGLVEIWSGLSEGEEVVSQGSFTLKSELLRETLGEEE